MKNELRTKAVRCVAGKEFYKSVAIDNRLNTYEHFYGTTEINGVDSKQNLTIGYY